MRCAIVIAVINVAFSCVVLADAGHSHFLEKPPTQVRIAAERVAGLLADQFSVSEIRYFEVPRVRHSRAVRAYYAFITQPNWEGTTEPYYHQFVAWFEELAPGPNGREGIENKLILRDLIEVESMVDFDAAREEGAVLVVPWRYFGGPADRSGKPSGSGVLRIHTQGSGDVWRLVAAQERPNPDPSNSVPHLTDAPGSGSGSKHLRGAPAGER